MFDAGAYPDLLRGVNEPDDAAVWRLDATRALVLTSDFFPPVVDDPYDFGAIAAANALSDIYAMGGEPLLGINLVGFPDDLDREILSQILLGGADKMQEAGAPIAGGHSTTDKEPKYGLAVVGMVHPDRLFTKGGIRPGDALFLTKPIGTGVITTAHKRDVVDAGHLAAAVGSMARLNRDAARLLRAHENTSPRAATDVTGFALAGHGHEMAHASGLCLRIRWDAVPKLPGAADYAQQGLVPGGAGRNADYYGKFVRTTRALAEWESDLLYDPQTSGGLLFAIAAERAEALAGAFARAEVALWRIGDAVAGTPGTIEIV
jgi:selenide,water dikinase